MLYCAARWSLHTIWGTFGENNLHKNHHIYDQSWKAFIIVLSLSLPNLLYQSLPYHFAVSCMPHIGRARQWCSRQLASPPAAEAS